MFVSFIIELDMSDELVDGENDDDDEDWFVKNVFHFPYNIVDYVQIPDGRGHNDTRERIFLSS